jgi:hypothetical protein
MLYQAPDALPSKLTNPLIFIAGGISNCPNWQADLIKLIDVTSFDVANPRRVGDLAKSGPDAKIQIVWEQNAMDMARHILFWFPAQSVCPITLFELGKMLEKSVRFPIKITIGYDPDYQRKFDLEVQTEIVKNLIKLRKSFSYDHSSIHVFNNWKKFTVYVDDQYGYQ